MARRLVQVEVRWSPTTYHAKIRQDSGWLRATCTSGHEQAARAAASKYFGCEAKAVELRQTNQDMSFTGTRTYDAWHEIQIQTKS